MTHPIAGGEVDLRRLSRLSGDELIQRRVGGIDEEHRAGLGIEGLNVPDTVIFLVWPGELVLANDAFQVILATGSRHQPGLAVRAHHLAVKVEIRLGVWPECALGDELLEILPPPGIDRRRVNVRAGRQIDLWLANMEKAQRIAGGDGTRLFGGHDIVRQLANARRQPRFRPQRGKRSNGSHEWRKTYRSWRRNARRK